MDIINRHHPQKLQYEGDKNSLSLCILSLMFLLGGQLHPQGYLQHWLAIQRHFYTRMLGDHYDLISQSCASMDIRQMKRKGGHRKPSPCLTI